jgi:hypothetical protein
MTPRARHARRARAFAAAFVAACAATSACVSLAGLTGGVSGDDAGKKPDANVLIPLPDAAPDHANGRVDASKDGGHDGGAEGGKARDAGAPEAACHPFMLDAGQPSACTPVEAGTCAPASLPDATFPWRPAQRELGACTPALIAGFIASCISDTSNEAACKAYFADEKGVVCGDCIDSDLGDSMYGAAIQSGGVVQLNIGGCIALVDPCNQACAEANEAALLCGAASCGPSCGLEDSVTNAQLQAFEDCATASGSCACAPERAFMTACNAALKKNVKTAPCFPGNLAFEDALTKLASLFCYNGSFDAGSADAATSDGGGT